MTTIGSAAAAIELPFDAATVWRLVGGFGALPDWLPYITTSELGEGGRTRRLTNPDGEVIVERLLIFDEDGRSYSYAILQAPFPVTDYVSTLRVSAKSNDAGSRVIWSGHFTPRGVSAADATQLFQGIYDAGLAALAAHYQSQNSAAPA